MFKCLNRVYVASFIFFYGKWNYVTLASEDRCPILIEPSECKKISQIWTRKQIKYEIKTPKI